MNFGKSYSTTLEFRENFSVLDSIKGSPRRRLVGLHFVSDEQPPHFYSCDFILGRVENYNMHLYCDVERLIASL